MRFFFEAFTSLFLLIFTCANQLIGQGINITYLANEGVWIQNERVQIMIDPLFSEDFDTYFTVPEDEKQKIRSAAKPYHEIDYLIVSHNHADHFDAYLVRDFLVQNQNVILLAPPQVIKSMIQADSQFENFSRIRMIELEKNGRPASFDFVNVSFAFNWIQHAGSRNASVQNLLSTIKIRGNTILHFGDAQADIDLYDQWELPPEGVDLALVPVWFLIDGEAIDLLNERIQPRNIAVVHVPRIFNHWVPEIKEDFPEAILFTTFGKSLFIDKN